MIWEARICPVIKMFLDLVIMNCFVLSGFSAPWFYTQSGERTVWEMLVFDDAMYCNDLLVVSLLPYGLGGAAACRSLPSGGGGPLHPAAATSYFIPLCT